MQQDTFSYLNDPYMVVCNFERLCDFGLEFAAVNISGFSIIRFEIKVKKMSNS